MPDYSIPGIMSDIVPDIMPVSDPDSVASRGDYRKREDTSFGDVRVNSEGIVSGDLVADVAWLLPSTLAAFNSFQFTPAHATVSVSDIACTRWARPCPTHRAKKT
jgi:hypothetical protein